MCKLCNWLDTLVTAGQTRFAYMYMDRYRYTLYLGLLWVNSTYGLS